MKNSIEEDIKNAEHFIKSIKTDKEYKEENGWHGYYNKEIVELARILQHILSDYKRVLKENEELNLKYYMLYTGKIENLKAQEFKIKSQVIPVQKVKDIIDRIDYDIKKTKEIISKNTNIYASYRRNDYQIVRLRAMNTKSLDIKKRTKELKKYAKRENELVYDDIILNLINKLQKENEELKNQEATQRKINELLVQRYSNLIPVQKVKDKIEELKQEKKKYGNCLIEMYEDELVNRDIKILQELLESEK